MGVYLRAKFEVSGIILTGFRHGTNFTPPPAPQNESLKGPPRLGLIRERVIYDSCFKRNIWLKIKVQPTHVYRRCFEE